MGKKHYGLKTTSLVFRRDDDEYFTFFTPVPRMPAEAKGRKKRKTSVRHSQRPPNLMEVLNYHLNGIFFWGRKGGKTSQRKINYTVNNVKTV